MPIRSVLPMKYFKSVQGTLNLLLNIFMALLTLVPFFISILMLTPFIVTLVRERRINSSLNCLARTGLGGRIGMFALLAETEGMVLERSGSLWSGLEVVYLTEGERSSVSSLLSTLLFPFISLCHFLLWVTIAIALHSFWQISQTTGGSCKALTWLPKLPKPMILPSPQRRHLTLLYFSFFPGSTSSMKQSYFPTFPVWPPFSEDEGREVVSAQIDDKLDDLLAQLPSNELPKTDLSSDFELSLEATTGCRGLVLGGLGCWGWWCLPDGFLVVKSVHLASLPLLTHSRSDLPQGMLLCVPLPHPGLVHLHLPDWLGLLSGGSLPPSPTLWGCRGLVLGGLGCRGWWCLSDGFMVVKSVHLASLLSSHTAGRTSPTVCFSVFQSGLVHLSYPKLAHLNVVLDLLIVSKPQLYGWN